MQAEIETAIREAANKGPYSKQAREAVFAAAEAGMTRDDVAEIFSGALEGTLWRPASGQKAVAEYWEERKGGEGQDEEDEESAKERMREAVRRHYSDSDDSDSSGPPSYDYRNVVLARRAPEPGDDWNSGRDRVVSLGQPWRATDSDPARHGSHLLGHEGERVRYAYVRRGAGSGDAGPDTDALHRLRAEAEKKSPSYKGDEDSPATTYPDYERYDEYGQLGERKAHRRHESCWIADPESRSVWWRDPYHDDFWRGRFYRLAEDEAEEFWRAIGEE